MSSAVYKARSRVAVAARQGNCEEREEARKELAAAKIAAYIDKIVAEAPPLSREQLDSIAAALHTSRAVPSK